MQLFIPAGFHPAQASSVWERFPAQITTYKLLIKLLKTLLLKTVLESIKIIIIGFLINDFLKILNLEQIKQIHLYR